MIRKLSSGLKIKFKFLSKLKLLSTWTEIMQTQSWGFLSKLDFCLGSMLPPWKKNAHRMFYLFLFNKETPIFQRVERVLLLINTS